MNSMLNQNNVIAKINGYYNFDFLAGLLLAVFYNCAYLFMYLLADGYLLKAELIEFITFAS